MMGAEAEEELEEFAEEIADDPDERAAWRAIERAETPQPEDEED
jgi:hypothetical protein